MGSSVGALLVGARVDGARVVGCTVVGASVVGCSVVGIAVTVSVGMADRVGSNVGLVVGFLVGSPGPGVGRGVGRCRLKLTELENIKGGREGALLGLLVGVVSKGSLVLVDVALPCMAVVVGLGVTVG